MSVSLPSRILFCLCLAAGTGAAQASVQNQPTTPTGPTMGDIVRQATQPAPAAAGPAVPAANLPTMGDIVKQTEGQAKAAAAAAGPSGCTRPKPPGTLPDGTKATDEEMRKAQLAVKAYVSESEAFNTCLDKLVQANIAKLSVHEYLSLTAQHDLTISAMQLFADRFNQQLRAYKAKSAPAAKP